MKLNKVLKKLREDQKKAGISVLKGDDYSYNIKKNSNQKNSGFSAKGSSSVGASRQRSIGNRNYKPTKKIG